MKLSLLTRLLVFLSLTLLASTVWADNGYQNVDAASVKQLMEQENALVVFPLSPMEFKHEHIEDSVNIIMAMLEYELPDDKDRKLVFYCLGIKCVASRRAAEKAVAFGYRNVYTFREGIPGWEQAGYPLVSTYKLPDVKVEKVSTSDLAAMLNASEMILLDVNLEDDAKRFYIDNDKRKHIPLDDLNVSLPQLPKNKQIAVICLKGKRSPIAVKYLVSQGYKNVVMVDGGLQKWILEGRPIRKNG
ncbi:MAG: rhodanese-like domain-containing protein [Desulfuromonadales bacterium]|nr:rhodanese-like domain-containing protein [Desulfuromonadales bacterium]